MLKQKKIIGRYGIKSREYLDKGNAHSETEKF